MIFIHRNSKMCWGYNTECIGSRVASSRNHYGVTPIRLIKIYLRTQSFHVTSAEAEEEAGFLCIFVGRLR